MNILILSVGTRNKIVQYFKKELKNNGKVIATDCSEYAPALYEADGYYIVPRITNSRYLDIILEIVKKEKIDGVLSLIDPELLLLSKYSHKFEILGAKCIVSPYEIVKMSFNKMNMYRYCLKNNFNTIKSFDNLADFLNDYDNGKISFPVIIKPICGSASTGIQKIDNIDDLKYFFSKGNDLMIQEFIKGHEIGCDVYIDAISGEVTNIFMKKKILMRAGETDKSISFYDDELYHFIKKFVEITGYKWNIDIDIFEKEGKFLISEVNPRFGGGYPHAYECGINFPSMIIKNLQGLNSSKISYEENVVMLKYPEIKILKRSNISEK